MYNLYKAVQERIVRLMMAETSLTEDASTGADRLSVEDTSNFGTEAMSQDFAKIILIDDNSTGRKTASGIEGTTVYDVKSISGSQIFIDGNLSRNWTTALNSRVKRAPNGVPIERVIIGDFEVMTKFPVISIVPISKNIEWYTLSGTKDNIVIDFMVYVRGKDSENATLDLLKLSDSLEWVLMSNLHIQPNNANYEWERTNKAIVRNVEYGSIQKGSEFLKAAKLTWEADLYFWRYYLTAQGLGTKPPLRP